MSLSDHLRYLRAMRPGLTPEDIAEALGLETPGAISQAEKRYRPVLDEALIAGLAQYYGQPLAEFQWHNARARKYLTFYVQRALANKMPATLTLRGGQTLSGRVVWWDLGAIGLETGDGLLVVQRHAVVDWPGAEEHWWET